MRSSEDLFETDNSIPDMSWMDHVSRELGMHILVLPMKMQLLFRRMLGGAMSQSERRRMEELGAKVGLTKKETLEVIASYPAPVGSLDLTPSAARIRILMLLVVLIVLVLAFTLIAGTPTGAGPTTTYVPGTRYASISPRDFE
jgi:hypothetical protein